VAPNTYLLSLAALAVTFVGFASLVVTLRQIGGGNVSKLDAFLTRTFIQLGFLVAAGALLPPLLALSSLAMPLIWRIASVAVAAPAIFFAVTYPYRRQIASGVRTPTAIWADVLVLFGIGALLAANASGLFFQPEPFLFAGALTLMLCLSGWAYLQALQLLLREHVSRSSARASK